MHNIFQKRCAFQTPICVAIVLAFLGVYVGAAAGNAFIALITLVLALVLSVWSHIVYINGFADESADSIMSNKISAFVLFFIYALTALSLAVYSLRTVFAGEFEISTAAVAVLAALFAFLAVFEILFLNRAVKNEKSISLCASVRMYCRANRKLVIALSSLCAVLILLNLEIFGAWFRWDSYEYYGYASRQTLASFEDLEAMRLANHSAYMCSVIYFIVNGITGDMAVTVYLVNLMMLVIGAVIFFRIAYRFSSHKRLLPLLLITCVYAFSPFTHGLAYSISLETFLTFGILLYFYGEAEHIPAVKIIAALIICFSKETGAVILVAIMALKLVINLFSRKDALPFYKRLELPTTLCIFAVGLMWLYDFLSFSWISSNTADLLVTTDGKPFNNFAISTTYIKDRAVSFLFGNFTWLILLVVLVGFAVGFIRRKTLKIEPEKLQFILLVTVGFVASLFPVFSFITYNHMRYVMPSVILLLVLLPFALEMLFGRVQIRSFLCGALALCSFAQCYLTVDPFMHLFFDTIDKGNGKIIYTSNNVISDKLKRTQAICVPAQYNREIMYFDFAMDELLSKIDYKDDDCILYSAEYEEPFINGYLGTEYLILGFGYPYTEDPQYIAMDEQNKTRYLSSDKTEKMDIRYVYSSITVSNAIKANNRAIYIQLPFRDNDYEEKLLEKYNRAEIARVNIGGWEMVAFEITRK